MSKEKLKDLIKELLREKNAAGLTEWEKKRREFSSRCAQGYSPESGEICNVLDGLTPDGYNKHGVKVSFVEHGTPVFGRRNTAEKTSLSRPLN